MFEWSVEDDVGNIVANGNCDSYVAACMFCDKYLQSKCKLRTGIKRHIKYKGAFME